MNPNNVWPFTPFAWVAFFFVFFVTVVIFIKLFAHNHPDRKMRNIEVFMTVGISVVMASIWQEAIVLYCFVFPGFFAAWVTTRKGN